MARANCAKCHRVGYATGPDGQRLCSGHYSRAMGIIPEDQPFAVKRRQGAICAVVGCGRKPRSKGFCGSHYWRHMNGYDTSKPIRAPGRLEGRSTVHVSLPAHALKALENRCKATGVRMSALLRALVVRWAETDGAERRPDAETTEREAWRHSGYDMRGG